MREVALDLGGELVRPHLPDEVVGGQQVTKQPCDETVRYWIEAPLEFGADLGQVSFDLCGGDAMLDVERPEFVDVDHLTQERELRIDRVPVRRSSRRSWQHSAAIGGGHGAWYSKS